MIVLPKVFNNNDIKTLVSNFGFLSLLQVANYLFPLISVPYLARVLGPDGMGKIAFASAVIAWFNSIVTWGFNYTATRDVSRNRHNLQVVSDIFSNVLWTRLTLTFISFTLLIFLTIFIPKFHDNRAILYVTFLMVLGQTLFPDWIFQALERMKYITILNVCSRFIFTIAVFFLIREKSDYILQPLCISLGYLCSGIISLYIIIHKWGIKLLLPSLKGIYQYIKGSADVFLNNFAPNLYNSMSSVFLGIFAGDVANGFLNAGTQFINLVDQFMTIVSRTFFPFLARRIDKHSIYAKYSIIVSFICAIGLFVFAPIFIKIFYTKEFNESILLARILAPSLVFLTVSNVYGTNYLILVGYERQLRNVTVIISIIGLLIGACLIYKFHAIGAAVTITLTRGLLALFIWLFACRSGINYKAI